ncbi:MAG TPA: signal peptidase I [Opitutaceae bacterium]|nr:signal peptidase I [Opitutaceae bacterium]
MRTEFSLLGWAGKKILGFVGLADANQKMRDNAANWLELADKVYHFRRDVLPNAQLAELQSRTGELRALLKERAGAEKLKIAIERLEDVLRRTGGAIYPKTALVENVEFFLVAAIVILGIRTYFVQPFKIPTNSMWPTYNGMTPEVFRSPAEEPGTLAQAARLVAFGARPKRVDAPTDGEVLIPLVSSEGSAFVPYRSVPGRTWLVFPTTLKEYTLLVGREPVTVQVPADFDFEWAVRDAFFPNATPSRDPARIDLGRLLAQSKDAISVDGGRARLLPTGKRVRQGERVLAFDIVTGDQLFVDRMSYHFVRPSVGSGFVFRTGNIPGIANVYGDQYYIKRLVGVPGDELAVKDFRVYRNGAPITGSSAFEKNATREGNYVGYRNEGLLSVGQTVHVLPHSYFAMGDNSSNSADGRFWGFVPAKDVVGRPLFVYFPFTRHWGPAR